MREVILRKSEGLGNITERIPYVVVIACLGGLLLVYSARRVAPKE